MSQIKISSDLLKQFESATGPIELIADDGVAVGYFIRANASESEEPYDWELSTEEIERRRREGKYITSAELRRRLGIR